MNNQRFNKRDNDKLTIECHNCKQPLNRMEAYGVRLNNQGLPNSDNDEWGYIHKNCMDADGWAELSGEKYFGRPIYDPKS